MSDIKLFKLSGRAVSELAGSAAPLEKSLQTLFEENLEPLLGVRFLASEFVTSNGGRMDTLGIDENGYPVIIEYKRQRDENVINQGLFYLDWLMDHRGDFEILVRDRFDKEAADNIEWSAPRLICIASDFTRYDEHAVKQMSRNIELIRYRRFGEDLLLLDLLTAVSTKLTPAIKSEDTKERKYQTQADYIAASNQEIRDFYADVENYMISLGDDISKKELRMYIAFKRIKNFACIEAKPQLGQIRLYLKIDPSTIELEDSFTRDVTNTGHYGTGDLEVTLKDRDDFERAKPLILQSYEAS